MAGRRNWTRENLAAGVREGDRRALARAISLVEDGDPLAYGVVADLYPQTGSTYSVGVTGPPGVGKSSLVSALIRHVPRLQVHTGTGAALETFDGPVMLHARPLEWVACGGLDRLRS